MDLHIAFEDGVLKIINRLFRKDPVRQVSTDLQLSSRALSLVLWPPRASIIQLTFLLRQGMLYTHDVSGVGYAPSSYWQCNGICVSL
jgi:hypothetical protein